MDLCDEDLFSSGYFFKIERGVYFETCLQSPFGHCINLIKIGHLLVVKDLLGINARQEKEWENYLESQAVCDKFL